MESTPENNTYTPPEGGQDTFPGPASQVSPDRDQLIDTTPLRDFSKDLSEARSDPGSRSRHELELLAMNPTVTLEDCRKPRVSVRELQNLASANAPGRTEDLARGTTRRAKRSYVQLKKQYDVILPMVMEDEADLPHEREELILPSAKTGIKSSFTEFKSVAQAFLRIATELKELLQSQGASAEVCEIDKNINEVLARIASFRHTYEDVLSFTSSWHPGCGSQVQRPPSRAASVDSRLSARTTASELEARQKLENQQRADELEIELEADQAKNTYLSLASQEEADAELREIEATRRSEELRRQAEELRKQEEADAELREIEAKRRSEELRRQAEELRKQEEADARLREIENKRRSDELKRQANIAAKKAALHKRKEILVRGDSDLRERASLNSSLEIDRALPPRGPAVAESYPGFVFPSKKRLLQYPRLKGPPRQKTRQTPTGVLIQEMQVGFLLIMPLPRH